MRNFSALAYDVEICLRALRDRKRNSVERARFDGVTDILFCLVDHFEPQVGGAEPEIAKKRLNDWIVRYPQIADRHRDADGKPPTHSFFYPWDEYDAWELCELQKLCDAGYGEIEVHLHHRDDTEESLRAKFLAALEAFSKAGALAKWRDGRVAWGFIHGNWALDNSRKDSGRNYCGVDSEIRLLKELGCYADFTFPAWNQTAQPRLTNTIFYATDDPDLPKSHDAGTRIEAGVAESGDLLLVQGSLTPYLEKGRGKPRIAVDDGDIASYRRYAPARMDRWVESGIHVKGRPDRVFIKLHSHGAADFNREAMLGSDLEALFSDIEARYNDGKRYRLHYVTAREMYNVAKATEANADCEIDEARDWLIRRA